MLAVWFKTALTILSLPVGLLLNILGLLDLKLMSINISMLWAYLLVVVLSQGPYRYVPKSQRKMQTWAQKKWGFLSNPFGK